jgi:hypothetical protein
MLQKNVQDKLKRLEDEKINIEKEISRLEPERRKVPLTVLYLFCI